MNYFYYYDMLIVILAVSIVTNILLAGLLLRWIRYAKAWQGKYDDAIAPVVPVAPYKAPSEDFSYLVGPAIPIEPEDVEPCEDGRVLGYPWEGEWD